MGKVTASPRAQAKARENIQERWNHNQDQAGSPNEDGQRTLGDFSIKRQRVDFAGDVQVLRSKLQECYGFDGTAKFVEESF